MNTIRPIFYIVRKEWSDSFNNLWITIIAVACSILSFFVCTMGFSFTGGEVQIEALLLSIVNLQLYTVPLLGILLVYDAIIGERESAMFDVHLTRGVGLVSFLLS